MSFEHSLREFLAHTLAAPQFFRLTIDLKKLKFVPPICELVVEDRNYADSISLSYLTSPVFQSNDVFHAVNARQNTRDPTELLITDGFCSFRFEDQLLWRDFVKLFVATPGRNENGGGAVLPIYVRARQDAEKCSTLGVATLKFSSILAPDKTPTIKDMPQVFFTTCLNPSEPATATSRQVDLPIFELLLKLPLLTKDTAAMAGVLTVGIAIDIMHVTLHSRLFAPDRRDDAPCWKQTSVSVQRIPQVLSAPISARVPDEDVTLVERCFTDTAGGQLNKTAIDFANFKRFGGNDQTGVLDITSRQISTDSNPTAIAFRGPSGGDCDSSHATTTAGKDHLLQCEMMLLKLNAEQAHQKFREEVKMIEAKSEERIETIRKENQKLRNENRQLEKKLIDFEQKLQMLQDSIVKPPICTHSCASSTNSSQLRKENERLQLLLRAERQKTTNSSTLAESDAVPHAHSVHPVYHQPNERRTVPPAFQRLRTPLIRSPEPQPSSSSSSNTDSSPLSSRSRQLLAIHLKRSP